MFKQEKASRSSTGLLCFAGYKAIKQAIIALTKAARIEYARSYICVNPIAFTQSDTSRIAFGYCSVAFADLYKQASTFATPV